MLAKQPIGMLAWGHETDRKFEKQQRNGGEEPSLLHFATSFYLESGHGWTAELKFREERRENDAKYYLE